MKDRKRKRTRGKLLHSENAKKAALFAAFGALMYLKGRIVPKYADDYPYSFKWDPRYGNLTRGVRRYQRVKSLKDLLRSQAAHYKNWDGRVLADFLVQLNLMKDDKRYFDAINTAVILGQLLLCGSLGRGKRTGLKDMSFREVLLLTAGFWHCTPHLIATCFWLTGSVTYLWTGFIDTLYLLPYALHYHDDGFSFPAPAAAVLGLAAGCSTEVGAGGSIMLSGMELIRSLREKQTSGWMLAGVLGACTGLALLLLAPGNRIKFRLEAEMSDTLPENMEERLPGYVPPEVIYTPTMFRLWFLEGFLPTILRELPLSVPVLLYFMQTDRRTAEATQYILALEAAALAIPTVMMLSPEYPRRATYPSVLFKLSAAIKAMEYIDMPAFSEWSSTGRLAGMAAAFAMAVNIISSLIVDADFHCQHRDQVETILKNRGKDVIHLKDVRLPVPYSLLAGDRSVTWDVALGLGYEDREDPYNRAAAAYYGADSIACDISPDTHGFDPGKGKGNWDNILLSLVDPLKSFFRVLCELLRGDKWPASRKKDDQKAGWMENEYKCPII